MRHPNFESGIKNPNWKGDEVSYACLHKWIARQLGCPKQCEHCFTTTAKKFEWANVSKKYLRELPDWIRLCTACHRKFDGLSNRGERCGTSKLNSTQVRVIKYLLRDFKMPKAKIGRIFKVSATAIRLISINKNWKHISIN